MSAEVFLINLNKFELTCMAVVAQELQTVMPQAVHTVGDTVVNGKFIPNFMVVNERALLYESTFFSCCYHRYLSFE